MSGIAGGRIFVAREKGISAKGREERTDARLIKDVLSCRKTAMFERGRRPAIAGLGGRLRGRLSLRRPWRVVRGRWPKPLGKRKVRRKYYEEVVGGGEMGAGRERRDGTIREMRK
jgi:hypothetical protein